MATTVDLGRVIYEYPIYRIKDNFHEGGRNIISLPFSELQHNIASSDTGSLYISVQPKVSNKAFTYFIPSIWSISSLLSSKNVNIITGISIKLGTSYVSAQCGLSLMQCLLDETSLSMLVIPYFSNAIEIFENSNGGVSNAYISFQYIE